jgi:para-aminobenzoate synthetase component 1
LTLKDKLDYFGKLKIPFFFVISYDTSKWDIIPLNDLPKDILYNIDDKNMYKNNLKLDCSMVKFSKYKKQFNSVIKNIKNGNSYLLNLTSKTKLNNNLSLINIFHNCNSKYKLYYKNKFLSFSPETFIKINQNKIYSYPMKGTINSSIKGAKDIILNDKKELAEHTMIVDLIRNDLSIIASNIKVNRFRYIDKISAGDKNLYQVSSEISADLSLNWHEQIGDIITSLLPAGSITGTPKKSTIKLIDSIEDYNRDYFTGIWGIYDGNTLDSSVLIRFIENNNENYYYKSGGGITINSDCKKEYDEMNDKIYIP